MQIVICTFDQSVVTQAYSEASVLVDLWLPGKRRSDCFSFSKSFSPVSGAETVSHEAILFDVVVVVAGQSANLHHMFGLI